MFDSRRVKHGLFAAAGALALAAPASASGAVTLGPNPLPQRTSVIGVGGARIFVNSVVPGVTLSSSLDGVVVRWRVRRGAGPGSLPADTITLRILRPTGVANQFTAVGTSDAHAVPAGASDPIDVHEFPTRLPITTGDRVGLGTTAGTFAALAMPGASYLVRVNPLADGETATFAAGPFNPQAVLINADVEADADNDGFGDETQDQCPTDALDPGAVPSRHRPPRDDDHQGRSEEDRQAQGQVQVRFRRGGLDVRVQDRQEALQVLHVAEDGQAPGRGQAQVQGAVDRRGGQR
jgi:hypothetical protein